MSVLEDDGRHEDLPALISFAPTQFAAFQIFEIPFGPGPHSTRTDQELAQVFLTQAQVKTQPDQKIGSHGFSGRAWERVVHRASVA